MIKWILQKIVGSKNQREVRRIRPTVARINEIEEALQREPAEKLLEFTEKWKSHLARYHALEVPAKPVIDRMDDPELRDVAEALEARYKIKDVPSHTDETMLEAIARQRGAIQSGGRVNTTKAAELVIHDFRSAALGRVTLETPAEFALWLAEGKKADAERTLRKEGSKKAKKQARE